MRARVFQILRILLINQTHLLLRLAFDALIWRDFTSKVSLAVSPDALRTDNQATT